MKKALTYLFIIAIIMQYGNLLAQQLPVNCDLAIPGCTTPNFTVNGSNPSYNITDFTAGSYTNPSSNPQGVNSGCLLSGETVSTFISITIITSGTLQWSLIGLNAAGNPSGNGCFDWIMWQNTNGNACTGIHNNTLAPIACNWNGTCNGNTGMSTPANYPPNASSSSYQPPINVNAGDQFILCLSNYSYTNQNVNLNFFGSAQVTCNPHTPDQTICLGSSATVNILAIGLTNPTFNWLITTGVSNPTSGANVTVTPTDTTMYVVEITADEGVFLDTFYINVVPPPTPNAGPDQVVCSGTVIHLNGTISDPANSKIWSHITTGITPTPSVNYQPNNTTLSPNVVVNQPGLYKFILTENNNICPAVKDTVEILVSKTTHTTSWTGPSCAGMTDGTITITNANAVDYSFDGGLTWVTNATQGGFGMGTFTVFSRNQYGCTFSSSVTITDPAPLLLHTSNDTLICQNGFVDLAAWVEVQGLNESYHWSGTTSTSGTVHLGPFTTDQTITVYAEGQSGCTSNTETINVSVRQPLSALISPNDTICPGYPTVVKLTNVAGGLAPYSIVWNTGETQTGVTEMEIPANPPQTQQYIATISDVCETTPLILTTQVYVAPLPEPKMSVVTPELCEPASFELHYETDMTMTSSYTWFYPKNKTATNEPIVFTDSLMAGKYDVSLIVISPLGCVDSIKMVDYLTVQPRPTANFTWSPNPVKVFNTDVYFQNLSELATQYSWIFTDGTPSYSSQERPKVTYPYGETGTYPVTLIVTSELGCTDTLTQNLIVYPDVVLFVPNTFTPDGDEFNQSWKIHISGIDVYSFHLQVFNRWGEMIFESSDIDAGWDGTYNGRIIETGAYSWKISARDLQNDGKYEWNGHVNILK
ncbi:MAG: gliding motility-associated C-terminal domain-containing protein [Crocinitomicaceae bacterium]|nr:gliding motility-associated C-terminal domain-containing protein [Crocinitomicaceae bacterium]